MWGPGICLLLNPCLGRGRKWSQRPRYLGDAGNSGLPGRMAHSGGGKGHGTKFTRGQASPLAPQDRCILWSSGEKRNCVLSWERLAGSPRVQLGASPGRENDVSACRGRECAQPTVGKVWALMKCLDEATPTVPASWLPSAFLTSLNTGWGREGL